jgi:hypothetical protein
VLRVDGALVLDFRPLIPPDPNFVGGLRNLLAIEGRRFVLLTTGDERVLVAEAASGTLDTLLISSSIARNALNAIIESASSGGSRPRTVR